MVVLVGCVEVDAVGCIVVNRVGVCWVIFVCVSVVLVVEATGLQMQGSPSL